MYIVAAKAGDSMCVHHTRHEIVSLHPVLVSRPVRKMRERRLTELVLFKLPEFGQIKTDVEPDRPVVVFFLNWILQGLTLRVTLDTDIVRLDVIQARRIHDAGSRRFAGVLAAWAMAFLAPHVPIGDGFRFGCCN
jgi:hypothetical protein